MSSRPARYESLDVWRGVACLSVVVFHTAAMFFDSKVLAVRLAAEGGPWEEWTILAGMWGWVGVPIFFVVSGYCIATAAEGVQRRGGGVGTYFRRRIRRIYPPLWASMALTLPIAAAFASDPVLGERIGRPGSLAPLQWLGNLTLTEEWRHHLGGPGQQYLTGHHWTLCYEEQFYLIFGVLLCVARKWLFAGVAVISALVFVNLLDLPGTFIARCQLPYRGFFFDGQWLAFAAGVAVYYRLHRATPFLRSLLDFALITGFIWAGRQIANPWVFDQKLPWYLTSAFGFALILGWLHAFDARISRARVVAPLLFCGRFCYSLYLVHVPIVCLICWSAARLGITSPTLFLLVTLPCSIAASVLLGFLFFRFVERRFLNTVASTPVAIPETSTSLADTPPPRALAVPCGPVTP